MLPSRDTGPAPSVPGKRFVPTEPQQDVCCLMGQPVAANPTQYMLEAAFNVADLDWRFLTLEIPADDFERAIDGARVFGFRGIMLAKPHRGSVHPLLDEVSDLARVSGQINCIEQRAGQLLGHNTEGLALRKLVEQELSLEGVKAVLLGAGRFGKSAAAELASAGVEELTLYCLDPEPAQEFVNSLIEQTSLANCFVEPWPTNETLELDEDCRLLINATPVGRQDRGAALPIDLTGRSTPLVVADMVYNPPQTRLIRHAIENDCPTVDGLTLLVESAAIAFEIWTGQEADRATMRDAVEEFLVL